MLVAEAIAKALLDAGVKEVFGLPGGEVLDFIDAARRAGLPFVLTRHESAASFMADVTGQITGRPGACLSTLGPGATNMITGVANAYLDRSPVVAITGQMSPEAYGDMPHQRIDLCSLYKPVTKWSVRVTPWNAAAVVPAAVSVAMRRPRGPVHLELASTVSRSEAALPGALAPEEEPPADLQESTITIEGIARRLERCSRPAVIAGINCEPAAVARPLRAFAERHGIPVLVSPKAKGIFPDDHPLYVGVATGMAADDRVLEFLEQCDVILGVGFDASEADKTWPAKAPLIWLEDAPRDRAEWRGDYLVGSIPEHLGALADSYHGAHQWTREDVARARGRIREKVSPGDAADGRVSPAAALLAIREVLPEDGVFVCDVGAHKLLAGQAWPCKTPLTFFMSNGLSSMGYGLPAAMAAKRCFPDRAVVAVLGDGGFAMMVHDLETAVRTKAGVVYVVFNDESLSLIRVVQSRRKMERYGVDFGGARWATVAEALGAGGVSVTDLDGLRDAVAKNLRTETPVVIDLPVSGAEYDRQI
ncbi:MAG: thiamine pyrophosphate-binding protein [Firmicutes bacterium]|nr:thiamine pyrophosphate-binding protein [Bacillota bacterium]